MTDRLVDLVSVRPIEREDVDATCEWCTDPVFTRYLTWDPYESREAVEQHVANAMRCVADPDQRWSIVLDGTAIGSAHAIRRTPTRIQIGYGIVPRLWRHGISRVGLPKVIDDIGRTWKPSTLMADIHPEDQAGRALAQACGFRVEETLTDRDGRQRWTFDPFGGGAS